MAADLHIHVVPNEPVTALVYDYDKPAGERESTITRTIDNAVFKSFFSHTLGSKWFSLSNTQEVSDDEAYALISHTPSVWVGEVSWLKAALFENEEDFVPGVVVQISDLIGQDLPVIDDQLIAKARAILERGDNVTNYAVSHINIPGTALAIPSSELSLLFDITV